MTTTFRHLAHYFASKGEGKWLYITTTAHGLRGPQFKINVTSKAEARKLAAFYNAKPWNF